MYNQVVMPVFRVVLVRPEHEGNIGAVARSMANFDLAELYMVSPVPIGDEARKRAKHGNFILDSSKTVETLDDALEGCDTTVGTTGIRNTGEGRFLRVCDTPHEFAQRVLTSKRKYALLFGPEGLGLSNDELHLCDLIVSIPTSDRYPVLNLSHAATVLFYELFMARYEPVTVKASLREDKERVNEYFGRLLELSDYPLHKRQKAKLMFRRIIGRSSLSKWDFFILMGVLARSLKTMEKGKRRS